MFCACVPEQEGILTPARKYEPDRDREVLGQYLERFGTIDLRKVDEASLPKSLLILGLEGSRDGCSGLWVFKHRIEPVSSERREKWVGELEVKFPCWVSRATKGTRRVSAETCDTDSRDV